MILPQFIAFKLYFMAEIAIDCEAVPPSISWISMLWPYHYIHSARMIHFYADNSIIAGWNSDKVVPSPHLKSVYL